MLMKTIFPLIFIVLFWACTPGTQQQEEENDTTEMETQEQMQESVSIEQVWATDTVLRTPESVAYDRERDVVYVANIDGQPTEKDGNGFISKMNLDGEIVELEWVTGLDAPKGMGIYENSLYVTDIDRVVEINIEEGNISNTYPLENASFLNDITVAPDGKVYFTDSDQATISVLENGEITSFLSGDMLNRPNGLYHEPDRLMLASSGDNSVKTVDLETKEVTVLAEGIGSGDGIVPDGAGNYIVSNWQGEVYFLTSDNNLIKLLDTKEEEMNTADIDYVIEENLLLIPTFFDNRVLAYNLNKMNM